MELVCAHQNIRTFRRELRITVSHGLKELLALTLLQSITEAYYFGNPPLSVEALAEKLDIPIRVVRELLGILEEAGYLLETAGDAPTYHPARDIEHISVTDVLHTLKNFGGSCKISKTTREEELLMGILAKADNSATAALAGMTLKDLIGSTPQTATSSGNR